MTLCPIVKNNTDVALVLVWTVWQFHERTSAEENVCHAPWMEAIECHRINTLCRHLLITQRLKRVSCDHVQNLWNLRLLYFKYSFPNNPGHFHFPHFLSIFFFLKISEGSWQMQKVTLFSKMDFFLFHSLHFQEQNVQKRLTLCTLFGALLWFALGFKLLFKFSRAYYNLKITINSQCT